MSKDNILGILVGLPGSGKSTWADDGAKFYKEVVLISSDGIREEFGDVNDQSNNEKVFQEYYRRAEKALKEGKDVILDATNLTVKSRRNAIERLSKHASRVVAHYFNVGYEDCLIRNSRRDRKVPEKVISRMYKSLQIPTYSEGFDNIVFHNQFEKMDNVEALSKIEEFISTPQSYENIMGGTPYWGDALRGIWELPQDNSHHSFSVSRHTYHVWEYILRNYDEEENLPMLWAGLFHDAGKAFCKSFKRYDKDGNEVVSRYASFIGHENVSAQIAAQVLSQYYDTEFVLKVVEIIQYHMRLMQVYSNDKDGNVDGKAYKKLQKFAGNDLMNKLKFFYEADTNAK